MKWTAIAEQKPPQSGWYAAAMDPPDGSGDHSWRQLYGFAKLWFNDGRWWDVCPRRSPGHSVEVTERVTHWGELPRVP